MEEDGTRWGKERDRTGRDICGSPSLSGAPPPPPKGRTLEMEEEVMKKFHEVAGEYGLSGKDMHLLPWDSECPGPQGSASPVCPQTPWSPAFPDSSLSLSTVSCVNLLHGLSSSPPF